MHYLTSVIGILLILIGLSGCGGNLGMKCIEGEGIVETRELPLAHFQKLNLAMDAIVTIQQGPQQKIVAEALPNILDNISTNVEADTWTVSAIKCLRQEETVHLSITLPSLTEIRLNSIGDISMPEPFEDIQNLVLYHEGTGDIDVKLDSNVQNIHTTFYGFGEIRLSGAARKHEILITAAGNIRAYNLPVEVCDITVRSEGLTQNTRIRVSDSLLVTHNGSGVVFYRGYPYLNISIGDEAEVIDDN